MNTIDQIRKTRDNCYETSLADIKANKDGYATSLADIKAIKDDYETCPQELKTVKNTNDTNEEMPFETIVMRNAIKFYTDNF